MPNGYIRHNAQRPKLALFSLGRFILKSLLEFDHVQLSIPGNNEPIGGKDSACLVFSNMMLSWFSSCGQGCVVMIFHELFLEAEIGYVLSGTYTEVSRKVTRNLRILLIAPVCLPSDLPSDPRQYVNLPAPSPPLQYRFSDMFRAICHSSCRYISGTVLGLASTPLC